MDNNEKKGLSQKYEIGVMIASLAVIAIMVIGLTAFPEFGVNMAHGIMHFLTYNFGSATQVIALGVFAGLIVLALSKYGDIRLGNEKPEYPLISWVAMMFFCGNGAGTVYWAFLEWGYHFNAAPQLAGTEISEAYAYELSMAYCFYDWGPIAWAMLCVFVIPFAYHYYIKKDNELKFSRLTKYALGDKAAKGAFGKFVDFLFVFAAVGSVAITAGTAGSTIAATIADLLGINNSFGLTVGVLVGVTVVYTLTSMSGAAKGMKKISDANVYACALLLVFILVVGPTRFILDNVVNALGLMGSNFLRMTLWTDPVARTGYPQDWTVFYLIYWFVFGPFTGLFVAKISKGRKIKEIIANMLVTGSAGLVFFFGIVGGFQMDQRINGGLDVPAMLTNGQSEEIALSTLHALPFGKIIMCIYLFVIVLFLATTMDAISNTLSTTIAKKLDEKGEAPKPLKFAWCLILCALPIAIYFVGTDINTIKSIVLLSGLPLIIIIAIVYKGILKEMLKDFGKKSRQEILEEGKVIEGVLAEPKTE